MAAPQVDDSRSIGELFSAATRDVGELIRKEIELAKTETKEEVQRAAKGGAMFAVAGLAAFLALFLVSFAAAWGLAEVMPAGVAFLIVGIVYLAVAYVAFNEARNRMKKFDPVPRETVDTLKEDVQWVKTRGN